MVESHTSNFKVITTNFLGVRIFRKFMVLQFSDCSQRLKFMMFDIFLCQFYMCKCFLRMLNLQVIDFTNISENRMLANNSELTFCCKVL